MVNIQRDGTADGSVRKVRHGDGNIQFLVSRGDIYRLTIVKGRQLTAEVENVAAPLATAGAWELRFPRDRDGPPPTVTLDKLVFLSERPEPSVKYFSGTATYIKEINIPS